MKNQALFSSKGKSKKLKCCLLQILFGTLRVKYREVPYMLPAKYQPNRSSGSGV